MTRTERTIVFVFAVFSYLKCVDLFRLWPRPFLSSYGVPYGLALALAFLVTVAVRSIHRLRWGKDKEFSRHVTGVSAVVCTLLLASVAVGSLHDRAALATFWPQFIEFTVLYAALCACAFLAFGGTKKDQKKAP